MAENNAAVSESPGATMRRVEGTQATAPTNLYEGSAEQRWLADKEAADRADIWRDGSKVLSRDEKGNLIQREKVAGDEGEPQAGKPLAEQNGDAEKPPGEAEGERRLKIGDVELTEKEWLDIAAHKAEVDLKKAHVPAAPGDYKLELPKDLKLPEGMLFQMAKADDPLKGPGIQAAQAWAHKNGLSQAQFSELMGVYAASEANAKITEHNLARAEAQKLGVTGPARINAIGMFLRAHYGDAAARPMLLTMATEHQVKIWEDVIHKLTNQGSARFSQQGRDLEPRTIDDATWNKMSYHEQKEYAERASVQGGRR